MPAAPSKDTIYVDIDDEITGIIDKLTASKAKVVALVLPKRAAVLQSIVNMRLLKRSADDAKKNVVLITSEAGLLPLAGVAGLHVAKTLSSKPEIPTPPVSDDSEETIEEEPQDDEDKEITAATAGAMAVGALAGLPPKPVAADDMETVELDDDELPEDADDNTPSSSKSFTPKPKKKDSKLKVPNFERFRLLLILGILLLIVLISGLIAATKVLPKASITIKTDASNVNVGMNLTASTTVNTLDASNAKLPAKIVKQDKTYTQQTPATGQKNNGEKATGKVTLSAQACAPNLGQPASVPAGTGVSANGATYITQETTKFSKFGSGSGNCQTYEATDATAITAQTGGAKYNADGASFTVAGRSDVTGSGSADGGTDNNVQIVSQVDIDTAKSKITTTDATVKKALQDQLTQAGFYAITATYSAGTPVVTTSANVGDAASSVTVTEVVTYTMFGVHESDLKTLVTASVKSQIDTSKQGILTDGLDTASFTVQTATGTDAQLTMQATATVGPDLNVSDIKQQIAGMKSGQVKSALGGNPDVTSVDVHFSPFWVNSVPKDSNKVTVTIAKPTTTVNSSNDANP